VVVWGVETHFGLYLLKKVQRVLLFITTAKF
jgi:hypothetical protein